MVENGQEDVSQLVFKSAGDYHFTPLLILIVILLVGIAWLFLFKRNWLAKALPVKPHNAKLSTLEIKRVTPETTVIVMEKDGREFTIVESKHHIQLITDENNKNKHDQI
ncbi:hypothetical protein [Vibrio sp. MEBiC08052]|uniref:hypothetical protein n=1 Tax=Vibrio sp. MEBiC08052 TaxID=1761910 RepID=UPI0007405AF2|nr:hypothetical protein [Vibrio sp. MEBiC08052]KUI97010.1 hypothetical protein VRK_38650 [Vibrio sp. MEBiC08052]